MNQILGNQFYLIKNNNYRFNKYRIIFFISSILFIFFIILFFILKYKNIEKEKLSKELVKSYKIITLYNNENIKNYSTQRLNANNNLFIIGLISISKINITYPIFSSTSEELLEIGPCKFYRSTS